jgi:hypothetical protein
LDGRDIVEHAKHAACPDKKFVALPPPMPLPDPGDGKAASSWFDAHPLAADRARLFTHITGKPCTCRLKRGGVLMEWREAGCPQEWESPDPPRSE